MVAGQNGVVTEVAVTLAAVEIKPVQEAVLTLHQSTMENYVQDLLLNQEHVILEDVQSQVSPLINFNFVLL